MACPINKNALTSEVRLALINEKQNACPMAVRLAWHAAGTFEKDSKTGGSNGAGMRFVPESADGANAGLGIMRNILDPVKNKYGDKLSYGDLWTFAGASAVEFVGGPKITHEFGRSDHANGTYCPPNGRLPDASQGAQHLRDVFYRMGFNDQEIVALSGAHTLGRCHLSRSGFDGPWTRHPLRWDNQYFKNLLELEWTPRKWDGNLQYQDPSGELMMLPTDLALIQDPEFKKHVVIYANDQKVFDHDFALAFSKLLHLGVTVPQPAALTEKQQISEHFREAAMHGSHELVVKLADQADVHEIEATSGRTALHKSAFWDHHKTVEFLLNHCKIDANKQDTSGETALHDACRFGHVKTIQLLIPVTNLSLKNKAGQTPLQVAQQYNHQEVASLLTTAESKL